MLYLARYQPGGRKKNRIVEHMLGRELLRKGLLAEYDRAWQVESLPGKPPQLVDIRTGEKPSGVYFNISHTEGLAVCAVEGRPVGADAERIRPFHARVMERCFTKQEQAYIRAGDGDGGSPERFFRIWTLKESYCKAIGKGLAFPMKEISFYIDSGNKIQSGILGWEFFQYFVGREFIVSVCLKKADEGNSEGQQSGRAKKNKQGGGKR